MRGKAGPPRAPERRRLEQRLIRPAAVAARELLGCRLVRETARGPIVARIVETEAYLAEGDAAAHAWHGRTTRTEPLWRAPGTWYVFLVYGIHHCLNVAVERRGRPGCVLIRAVEIEGHDHAAGRGPGRLTRALGIDAALSGAHAFDPKAGLWLREGPPPETLGRTRRVGIRKAVEERLRFFDAASLSVSGPRRAAVGRR